MPIEDLHFACNFIEAPVGPTTSGSRGGKCVPFVTQA